MSILHYLERITHVKDFDETRSIEEGQITELLKSMKLTPSSAKKKPYTLIVVRDKALQTRISQGMAPLAHASHLVIIAGKRTFDAQKEGPAETKKNPLDEEIQGAHSFLNFTTDAERWQWTIQQCAKVASVLRVAAASLKIDTFEVSAHFFQYIDTELDLSDDGLQTLEAIALGYQDSQHRRQELPVTERLHDLVRLRYGADEE